MWGVPKLATKKAINRSILTIGRMSLMSRITSSESVFKLQKFYYQLFLNELLIVAICLVT